MSALSPTFERLADYELVARALTGTDAGRCRTYARIRVAAVTALAAPSPVRPSGQATLPNLAA